MSHPTSSYGYPRCSLCGTTAPVTGHPLCTACQAQWDAALPPVPQTREAALALPAYALPYALWECGLRPKGVTRMDKPGCIDKEPEKRAPYFYKGMRRWQPHTSFDDAAYLLNKYELSITYLYGYKTGDTRKRWSINDWTQPLSKQRQIVVIAESREGIPAALCRAGLLLRLAEGTTP